MNRTGLSLCALLAGMALAAFPAAAQTQPAPSESDVANAPEANSADIVVTARKVSEPLQKAPVAVTAFSQEQLREREIRQPQDLNVAVPSLLVSGLFTDGRNQANYSVRGLFVGGAIYLAGAPGGGGAQQFYDLANVQVVAGPQGTLFGRTSIGGAVLFEPNRPSFRFDGFAQASVGTYDFRRFEGMVNIPIIDDVLAVRAAGFVLRRDGYTTSLDTGQKLDDQHREGFRLGVQFNPFGDVFKSYTMLQYTNADENGTGSLARDYDPNLLVGGVPIFVPGVFATSLAPGFTLGDAFFGGNCGVDATRSGLGTGNANRSAFISGCVAQHANILATIGASLAAESARIASGANGGIRSTRTSLLNSFKSRNYFLVNNSTLDFGGSGFLSRAQLKNIFSYSWGDARPGTYSDLDGVATNLVNGFNGQPGGPLAGTCVTSGANIGQCTIPVQPRTFAPRPSTQISEEVNASATLFGTLDLLAGYFYSRSKNYLTYGGGGEQFGSAFNVGLAPAANNDTLGGNATEKGAFISGTLDLSDWLLRGLKIGAAYRRTSTNSLTTVQVTNYAFDAAGNPTKTLGAISSSKAADKGSTHNFTIDWQATNRLLVYARSGTGFQPGGNNSDCQPPNNSATCPLRFGKELATDYEIGTKFDWQLGDVRLRTTAAAYQTDFDDITVQKRVRRPDATTAVFLVNASAARVRGVELVQNLNYRRFSASLTYSLTDSRYKKYFDTAPGFVCTDPENNSANDCYDFAGSRLIASVRNKVGGTVSWKLPLSEKVGTIVPSLQATYTSSANYGRTLVTDPGSTAPGYTLVNGRIEWHDVLGSPIDATIFGRNILDKKYITYIVPIISIVGYNTVQYGEPATFGLELRYRFGASGSR